MFSKNLAVLVLLSSGLMLAIAFALGFTTPLFDPFSASGSYPCSGGYVDPECGPPVNDDFAQAIEISPASLPLTIGPVTTKDATRLSLLEWLRELVGKRSDVTDWR